MTKYMSIPDRIREKYAVDPVSGCWIWTGSLTGPGYGKIRVDGVLHPAHRVSYELVRGPIPRGLTIDHLCRVRRCVNPDHLEPVTMRENLLRGNGFSGINGRKKACKHGHAFTTANTILEKLGRKCRACHNARRRALRKNSTT